MSPPTPPEQSTSKSIDEVAMYRARYRRVAIGRAIDRLFESDLLNDGNSELVFQILGELFACASLQSKIDLTREELTMILDGLQYKYSQTFSSASSIFENIEYAREVIECLQLKILARLKLRENTLADERPKYLE